MMKYLLRAGSLLALVGVASCGDSSPAAPTMTAAPASRTLTASGNDEVSRVSTAMATMNSRLAAGGARVRVMKAELLMKANGWNGLTSTIVFANDRYRGIGMEWVPRDPRRDGRVGVTYAIRANPETWPGIRVPGGFARAPQSLVATQIEEGMQAWRNQSCAAPITQVAPGTNPDFIDEYFRAVAAGTDKDFVPASDYAQPADIIQSGFQKSDWFRIVATSPDDPKGESGNSILGITFTLGFVDAAGNETDIDRNGKADVGLAEIYYNPYYLWTSTGESGFIDFYSVMTHETGHSLGLGHFGKLFVTRHDAADKIQLADIKYAPYAIMNAAYVDGRNEIAGTDLSSFCQIWSAAK
jgi:hypothetical protein